jgi:hypothetical protein
VCVNRRRSGDSLLAERVQEQTAMPLTVISAALALPVTWLVAGAYPVQ